MGRLNAWGNPEATAYADKCLKAAKRRKHAEKVHSKDPDMDQYRVLKSIVEGSRDGSEHKRGTDLKGECDSQESAALACTAHCITAPCPLPCPCPLLWRATLPEELLASGHWLKPMLLAALCV